MFPGLLIRHLILRNQRLTVRRIDLLRQEIGHHGGVGVLVQAGLLHEILAAVMNGRQERGRRVLRGLGCRQF